MSSLMLEGEIKTNNSKPFIIKIPYDGKIAIYIITSDKSPGDFMIELEHFSKPIESMPVAFHPSYRWIGINKMIDSMFKFSQYTGINSENYETFEIPIREGDELKFSVSYSGYTNPVPEIDIKIFYKLLHNNVSTSH